MCYRNCGVLADRDLVNLRTAAVEPQLRAGGRGRSGSSPSWRHCRCKTEANCPWGGRTDAGLESHVRVMSDSPASAMDLSARSTVSSHCRTVRGELRCYRSGGGGDLGVGGLPSIIGVWSIALRILFRNQRWTVNIARFIVLYVTSTAIYRW